MKVILNIGHEGITKDPGATHWGVEEHAWNKDFVNNHLVPKFKEAGIDTQVIIQQTYPTLWKSINKIAKKGDLTLAFHLNSADPKATGTEMLYYEKSSNSKKLATLLQTNVVEALGLRSRGLQACNLQSRGGSLMVRTSTPCVILEPAFLSNENDYKTIDAKKDLYADAIVKSIKEYLGK